MPPGFAAPTAGVAALALVAGNDAATGLNAGAADAQLCGTESTPTEVARPSPALTARLLRVGEANAPELLPSAEATGWKLPNIPIAGVTDLITELAEPSIDAPEAPSDADEPAPDATLAPEVRAVDDVVRPVNAVTEDVPEDVVDAVSGAEVVAANGIDIVDVSGATVCALVPAPVPTACATAPAWRATPPPVVVGIGGVNGANVDATCAAAW
jgi:hypothetical protein